MAEMHPCSFGMWRYPYASLERMLNTSTTTCQIPLSMMTQGTCRRNVKTAAINAYSSMVQSLPDWMCQRQQQCTSDDPTQMIDFTFLSDDDIPLRTPQRWRALYQVQKMVKRSQRLLNLLEPAPVGTTMQAIEDNALQGYLERNEECLKYGLKARPHSMMPKEYVRYAMAGRTSRWVPVIEAGYSERCTHAYMPDSAKPECRSCEWPVEHIDHSVFCESCWAWIHLMCWQPHVTCHMLDKIGQKLTAENLERMHMFRAGDKDRADL